MLNDIHREAHWKSRLLGSYIFPGDASKNYGLSPVENLMLGDNIIILSAVIGIALYIDSHEHSRKLCKSLMPNKIHEILTGKRHIHFSNSIDILDDLRRIDTLPKSFSEYCQKNKMIHDWLELRNETRSIRTGKRFLAQNGKIKSFLNQLVDNLSFLDAICVDVNGNVTLDSNILSVYPFIQIAADKDSIMRAYLLTEIDEAANSAYYYNLAYDDILTVETTKAEFIAARDRIIKQLGEKAGERVDDFYGMFADSYPAVTKLATHILDNTQETTHLKLWSKQKDDKLNDGETDLKNTILLDIIQKGPRTVLLEVAKEEKGELEDYLQKIIHDQKSGENYTEVLRNIEEKADGSRQNYRDLLAVEIAKRFGINIRTIGEDLQGISQYSDKIVNYSDQVTYASDSINDLAEAVGSTAKELEKLFKELTQFYSYFIYHNEDGEIRSGYSESKWKQFLISNNGSTLGILSKYFQENIIDPQKCNGVMFNIIGNKTKMKSLYMKYSELFGTGLNICSIRNYFAHDPSLPKKQFPVWDERNYREIRKIADHFFKYTNQFIELIKTSINKSRIFPYKLTFTVYSVTSNGIQQCGYKTDVFDSDKAKNMIIFTNERIDFNEIYYCLPDLARSNDKIWVKPFLVKTSAFKIE